MKSFNFTMQGSRWLRFPPLFLLCPLFLFGDFGLDTRGGQGGSILRVTSLESSGPGSLREALETKGPRIIIFEVGGVIDLGKRHLVITEPFLTLAGQTAPSPGITLIRGELSIRTHDVIIQHIRVRPGDAGEIPGGGWEPDGIQAVGKDAYNIIIDHCSVSWGIDENMDVSGPPFDGPEATSHDVTIRNCIIAEGLYDSTHSEGTHGKGLLVHDFCRNVAIVGNLFAHNYNRNPLFKGGCTGFVANNLIYNPADAILSAAYNDSQWAGREYAAPLSVVVAVGNVALAGNDTQSNMAFIRGKAHKAYYYLDDNVATWQDGAPIPLLEASNPLLDKPPFWLEGYAPLPSDQVVDHILKNAGARPHDRDPIDQRIIQDFLHRRGQVIDSQDDVGGYPATEPVYREFPLPDDQIEAWLEPYLQFSAID